LYGDECSWVEELVCVLEVGDEAAHGLLRSVAIRELGTVGGCVSTLPT
jgi:hypothetical protein